MPSGRRLLRSVADRLQWENASPKPDDEPRKPSPRAFGNGEGGMTESRVISTASDTYLTVNEVAAVLKISQLGRCTGHAFRSVRLIPLTSWADPPGSGVRRWLR
jgi:hypothetical protein